MHARDDRGEVLADVGGQPAGREAGGHGLQGDAHFVPVDQVGDGRLKDADSSATLPDDYSHSLEDLEGLADGGAADA